jgi:hypothetical protein
MILGALKMLGKATHTTQDLAGHGLIKLTQHGKEANYQTPEKVSKATQETKDVFQQFEVKLSNKVGSEKCEEILKEMKKIGKVK